MTTSQNTPKHWELHSIYKGTLLLYATEQQALEAQQAFTIYKDSILKELTAEWVEFYLNDMEMDFVYLSPKELDNTVQVQS